MAKSKWQVIERETRIIDCETQQPLNYEQHAVAALQWRMAEVLSGMPQTKGPKRITTECVISTQKTAKAAWAFIEQYVRDYPKYAFDRRYTYDVKKVQEDAN